jgi:hypothetical protein
MTTRKQRAANRRNAKKSTGPKTMEGRNRSKLNALKHGLTAAQIIVFDESAEDLENFHQGLIADWLPMGALEEQLVERIAICAWRLRRVYRIEARLFSAAGTPVLEAEPVLKPEDVDVDLSVFNDDELALLQRMSEQMSLRKWRKDGPSTTTAAVPSHKIASTVGSAGAPPQTTGDVSAAEAPAATPSTPSADGASRETASTGGSAGTPPQATGGVSAAETPAAAPSTPSADGAPREAASTGGSAAAFHQATGAVTAAEAPGALASTPSADGTHRETASTGGSTDATHQATGAVSDAEAPSAAASTPSADGESGEPASAPNVATPREAASTPRDAGPNEAASARSAAAAPREVARVEKTAIALPAVLDIGAAFRILAVSQGPLFQLSRHETTIERSLHRALHDLERLQARRKGEAVMAPVVLDISGGG